MATPLPSTIQAPKVHPLLIGGTYGLVAAIINYGTILLNKKTIGGNGLVGFAGTVLLPLIALYLAGHYAGRHQRLNHSQTSVASAVQSVLSVFSFTAILWNLSGTLKLFGVSMPRAMFWVLIVYVLIATIVGFWIGRPLIRLSFRNELTNAAFRYALVRVRDAAEAVGFYRGESAERVQLLSLIHI